MKNIINSTWDTLDLPTKASIMRESLRKGITDIDVIRKNYDSKYQNVNMLPEVEDNFSREQLYDLYNKVEGNNRNNNMYPSNSYGNLFVDGGYTDDTPQIFEDVFYTDLGSIPTVRGKSNMPSSIQLTKEQIKELKKKSHYQSFDYSHLSPDRRPIQNPTTFIQVPLGYGQNGYQLNNNSGESVTYYIDDSLPPDENGNYILSKLDLDSPIGKTYSDWKMTQEAFKQRMSNPNMYNLSSEDAVAQIYDDNSIKNPEEDYIPLDEVEVLGTSKKGEGNKKEATTSISTLTRGNGTLEQGIPNPYNFKGDEIKVTQGDGSRGVPGAGLFGDKTGTDLIREYNSNGNPVYYYPGYSNGSNGYYYPSPITIKWPDNYNLPDYSGEYEATHDGVPVEQLPFIEDDKLNLRDLLAWIQTQMNNRNYPAGDDSEFLLPKRSKQVSPKQVPTLLEESHVFKNKKSRGGKVNRFDDGGITYDQEDVFNIFQAGDTTYGVIPSNKVDYSKGVSNLRGEDIKNTDAYVKLDQDKNIWIPTRMDQDAENIAKYERRPKETGVIQGIVGDNLYGTLPEVVVGSESHKREPLSAFNNNAPAANAYDPYNNPAVSAQLNNLFNNDPVIKEQRRRFNDMAVANRTLGRNNWWEGVGIAMTPFNLVMPSNIYGAVAKQFQDLNEYASAKRENRIPNINGNFFDYLLGGNNLGFAQTTQGTRDWAEQHPFLNMGVNLVGDAITGYGIMKGVKNYQNTFNNIRNKYFFVKNPDSYTRGIGMGTEGIEDIFKTGVIRGNPRGTERSAKEFMKGWRHNREHFKDIMEDTGIKGIESKFQSRTLTEEEFNAIKKAAKKYERPIPETTTYGKKRKITIHNWQTDPLYDYETYDDYVDAINATLKEVNEMPKRVASGEVKPNTEQTGYKTINDVGLPTYTPIKERFGPNSDYVADGYPLSYWYPDGRNPITEGHVYAGSNYGVRVNNLETYTPFYHNVHLHPSFLKTPKLIDPSVELFGRGPFGITLKLDKTTGKPLIEEDLKKLFKRQKGKRK